MSDDETDGATLRQVLDVNVIGVVDTIRAFLPLLGRSAAPRIVNVSSTTASLTLTASGTDFGGDAASRLAYSTSKAALNMLTVQYANAPGSTRSGGQARLVGRDDQLRAITGLELHEQPAHVRLHRGHGELQPLRNLRV